MLFLVEKSDSLEKKIMGLNPYFKYAKLLQGKFDWCTNSLGYQRG